MTLRDRIPVEPLADERLTQIERRLVVDGAERSGGRDRGGLVAAAWRGAGVAAIAAAAVIGGRRLSVPASAPPPALQHVAVREGARVTIDGATLGGTASYEITRDPRRVAIELQRGRLELVVVHDPRRVVVIHAADLEIEDVGTAFRVDFDGTTGVEVRVTEGEVKITRRAQVVRVGAGFGWTPDRGVVALAALDPVDPGPVAGRGIAPGVASTAPAPGRGPAAPRAPSPMRAPVAEVPVARAAAHVAVGAAPHREAAAAGPRSDPFVDLRTAIRAIPLEHAPDLDGHADAATEIAKLKKLAYSTTVGPEASRALYQIAVLLHRPLGQDAEALRTLDWYFRRFAGGGEMHAAMWLRVRIACGAALDEGCRRAAYRYQHDVGAGAANDVAVRITNAP